MLFLDGSGKFFGTVISTVDAPLDTFISGTSTDMIASVSGWATAALTLVVILYGIKMYRAGNHLEESMWKLIYWGIIYAVALTSGLYQSDISVFFRSWPDWLAHEVVPTLDPATSITNFLDQVFANFMNVSATFKDRAASAGWGDPFKASEMFIYALVIAITGTLVCAYAMYLIVVSHIYIAILLAIGPFFIFMLIHERTESLFAGWITQLLTHGLVIVLAALTLTLITTVTNTIFASIAGMPDTGMLLAMFIMAYGALCFLVLREIKNEAARITGGMASSIGGLGTAAGRGAKNTASFGYDAIKGNVDADLRFKQKRREDMANWAKQSRNRLRGGRP